MYFDIFAFADYSGSRQIYAQQRHIVLATADGYNAIELKNKLDREKLYGELLRILESATVKNKKVLAGLDFSYSFPSGFFESITGRTLSHWSQLLHLLEAGSNDIPPCSAQPRRWAEIINNLISRHFHTSCGPFWGPGFIPLRKPDFPFGSKTMFQKRLVEERKPRMKSIYQLGGIGSVGLQSLYGIPYLARLRNWGHKNNIPLHFWPFDGWNAPKDFHVIIEVYPAIYNDGPKSDFADALGCVEWFRSRAKRNTLHTSFKPALTNEQKRRAAVEGWVPGIA